MHPVALAALSGVGLMAGIGIAFIALGLHDIHQQKRAYRQSAYYHEEQRSHSSGAQQQQPSQAQAAEAREDRVLQRVLAEVEQQLRLLQRMPAGEERRRAVRRLKLRYHPDKYPGSLCDIMSKVSAFINLQTHALG